MQRIVSELESALDSLGPWWLLYLTTALLLIVLLLINMTKSTEYTNEEYCNAIYLTEGDGRYGLDKKYQHPREVCLRTIAHAKKDFPVDFQENLSRRYCPYNSKVWLKNVRYFLRSGVHIQSQGTRHVPSGELDGGLN